MQELIWGIFVSSGRSKSNATGPAFMLVVVFATTGTGSGGVSGMDESETPAPILFGTRFAHTSFFLFSKNKGEASLI